MLSEYGMTGRPLWEPFMISAILAGIIMWYFGPILSLMFAVISGVILYLAIVARKGRIDALRVLYHWNGKSKDIKNMKNQLGDFTVIIMGAGAAGLMQCLHLLKNGLDGENIVIVDPRRPERDDISRDFKVGEALIEVSTSFFTKELGLHEYMFENHCPKQGLFFHWPKDTDRTQSIHDYYHMFPHTEPEQMSFLVNRAKLERDMLRMAIDKGVIFIHGKVSNVQVYKESSQDKLHKVEITKTDSEVETLTAPHIIDASGRDHVLGRKDRLDTLLKGPEHMFGAQNGSAWLRVKNIDRKIFDVYFHPTKTSHSWYYGTQHFFGLGHWVWMIAISMESRDFSIGVAYHKPYITPSAVNSKEKLVRFLRHHHEHLATLIDSGEVVDFHHWPVIAHTSKQFISTDGWYIIGEAAWNADPFYSSGLAITSTMVQVVTEAIRQNLIANESDPVLNMASWKKRVKWWDDLIKAKCFGWGLILWRQAAHLGHASAMSYRIYFENILYFCASIPQLYGKSHVFPEQQDVFTPAADFNIEPAIYHTMCVVLDLLDEVVDKNLNIGFMNAYVPGSLKGTSFAPSNGWDVDHLLTTGKFEPLRVNLFKNYAFMCWIMFVYLVQLLVKVRGVSGLFSAGTGKAFWHLLSTGLRAFFFSIVHSVSMWGVPNNSWAAKECLHFNSTYIYKARKTPVEEQ